MSGKLSAEGKILTLGMYDIQILKRAENVVLGVGGFFCVLGIFFSVFSLHTWHIVMKKIFLYI